MMTERMCVLDRICMEMKAKGKKYADWQNERYPVVASHKETRKYVVDDVDDTAKEN